MKVATSTLAALALLACVGLYGCGNSSDVTNAAGSLDSTPPPAPEGVSLNTVPEFNELTWAPSAAADVASYQVYQYQPDPSRDNAYVMVGQTTTPSLNLGRTSEATDTYYRVRAVDVAGNRSAFSDEANIHLPALGTGGGGPGMSGGNDNGESRFRTGE